MDFLDHTREQNPELIEAAVDLHQAGEIPPNTVVIDLDTVRQNARSIVDRADERDVDLYAMTKQFGRNPLVGQVIENQGVGFVAVDIEGVKSLHRHGLSVEHVGHLCQPPTRDVPFVVEEVQPEVVTVFSHGKARELAAAATTAGRTQDVLLRVVGEGDLFYPYQEGGFDEDGVVADAEKIDALDGLNVVGVTSFPTVRFNIRSEREETIPNMDTILRAAETLESAGIEVSQINAPGDTSSEVIDLLAEAGATHGEPGHGFFGTTPVHFFDEDRPEDPAWVYVTEVSHTMGNRAFAYGGALMGSDPSYGFWTDLYQQLRLYALIGDDPATITDGDEYVLGEDAGFIDYNVPLHLGRGQDGDVGDSVVYGFRNQVFVSRAKVAVVDGIDRDNPEVLGLFTRNGTLIDELEQPRGAEETKALMDAL
jgi:predicted amino acid racemase